jgi:hypothetical protein
MNLALFCRSEFDQGTAYELFLDKRIDFLYKKMLMYLICAA